MLFLLPFVGLAQNIVYEPLYNQTTFNNISTPTGGVGEVMPHSESVSLQGSASYSIPIVAPPGTNGMQPNISLSYNSDAGDGVLGQGWYISGLSVISNTSKDPFHDGYKSPPQLVSQGVLSLDGTRLIRVTGTQLGDQSTYAPENEDFSKITFNATGNTSFQVVTKSGTKMTYTPIGTYEIGRAHV